MKNWQNFAGCTAAAAFAFSLFCTAGCHQMSKHVRSDSIVEEQSPPIPPDTYSRPTTKLAPVPQSSRRPGILPVPQLLPPPPAPPIDSTQLQRNVPSTNEIGWLDEPVDLVDQNDREFFTEQTPNQPSEYVTARSKEFADHLAQAGIEARQRKANSDSSLPKITPGVPLPGKTGLKPVSAESLGLKPVPR